VFFFFFFFFVFFVCLGGCCGLGVFILFGVLFFCGGFFCVWFLCVLDTAGFGTPFTVLSFLAVSPPVA